jgi:uncharacterized repeat protein (TIGR03803 family)
VLLFFVPTKTASAQTFTTLASFAGTNGKNPAFTLVQDTDGNFYGTTISGGASGSSGSLFRVTPVGTLTTVYSFCQQTACSDGSNPNGGLVLVPGGDFYGTTHNGGTNGWGTAYRFNPTTGVHTTIYNFCSLPNCIDGIFPNSLIQAPDGNFYGTTQETFTTSEGGTVFRLTPAGILTTLYTFCQLPNCTDGWMINTGLVQGTDGNFYGTTWNGGDSNFGTAFKITPAGIFTSLYSFNLGTGGYPDGGLPSALFQTPSGYLYGTTQSFGQNGNGGTVFKMTPAGSLTTLYSFCAEADCDDGSTPVAAVLGATDERFYGTTVAGGASGDGTIFSMTPSGVVTSLHSFDGTDGSDPVSAVMQGTDGNLYGTTSTGGTDGDGTVFKLSTGSSPFVKTVPTVGRVGSTVLILGNNLIGATSATFNGTPAAFTVISPTAIRATVPAGATTGSVDVTSTTGTLVSNVVFRVHP